jgi:radical SAM superfamily enzyme YgiQ (UPF0313 family)
MRVGGCFIFGHPGETKGDMWQTIRFAQGLPLNTPIFTIMIPIPNSELFEEAKEAGRLGDDVWVGFMKGEIPYPLFVPDPPSLRTVARFRRMAYFLVYLWPPYIWRNRSVLLSPRYFFRSLEEFLTELLGKRFR